MAKSKKIDEEIIEEVEGVIVDATSEEAEENLLIALEESKNKTLRLQADFDNYRKRNASLQIQVRESVTMDIISQLLPLIDNFDRAIESLTDASAIAGVTLIREQLIATLTKYQVVEIDALDKTFDPNLHNAVMQVEDSERVGTVIAVLQKGYIFRDKVLRYSMVTVAK